MPLEEGAAEETAPADDSLRDVNVRRSLARLRLLWQQHAPASPMCLAEELEPGLTVGDFAVRLLPQRSRRIAGERRHEPRISPADGGAAGSIDSGEGGREEGAGAACSVPATRRPSRAAAPSSR